MSEITYQERVRLNRLCAEAFGFKPALAEGRLGCWYLAQPSGLPTPTRCASWAGCPDDTWNECPDFTRDMNAWLQWGISWLDEHGCYTLRSIGKTRVEIEFDGEFPVTVTGPRTDLPLLLCQVVEQIVGGNTCQSLR
jgi:hypothetical protein